MTSRPTPLHLTVGEVARRTGLTVRTLHHYDALGLVSPSARSEAGYRLYSARDIERLHAVQSLKQLGLGLDAIGATLAGQGVAPLELVGRQIAQAEQAIEQARALKDKLTLLHATLSDGTASENHTDALLAAMQLVATYQRFLPGSGVRQLLTRWRQARRQWAPLADELARLQASGAPVDTPEVQRLAQQWMNVAMAVFGGQLRTVLQWAQMHRQAPDTATHAGLDPTLLAYLEQAIGARLAALRRHLSDDELARLDGSLGPEWVRFAADGLALMATGTPPHATAAQALRERYLDLLARTVRHDPALGDKMRLAYAAEPILTHGHFVGPELRAYLAQTGT
jgi:DNA-binding transcriptional MerR regulator